MDLHKVSQFKRNILIISSFAVLLILAILTIKLRQFGYLHTAMILRIIYHLIVIWALFELVRSIYTSGNLFSKILKSIFYIPILALFMGIVFYLFVPVLTNGVFKYDRTDKAITNNALRNKFTALSEEMIKRNDVTWIGLDVNSAEFTDFVVVYPDGYCLFKELDIKGKSLKEPIPTIRLEDEDHNVFLTSGTQVRKILDENTYVFCKRAGIAIREVGIDRIKYSPKDKIVQYYTMLPIGMDSSQIKAFYYSGNGILPKEYSYSKKIGINWFSTIE